MRSKRSAKKSNRPGKAEHRIAFGTIGKARTVLALSPDKLAIANLKATRDRVEILAFEEVKLAENYYNPTSDQYTEQVELISGILAGIKGIRRQISVNLILEDIITRVIEIPSLSAKDLKKFIENNTQQYLTLNPEEYVIQYKIVGASVDEGISKDKVMIVGVPKVMLEQLDGFLEDCGLKADIVDVFANSMSRLFQDFQNEVMAVLHLDPTQSHFMIMEQGKLFLHTTFSPAQNVYSNYFYAAAEEAAVSLEISEEEILSNVSSYLNFFSASRYGETVDHLVVLGNEDNEKIGSLIKERFDIRTTIGLSPMVLDVKTADGLEFNPSCYGPLLGLAIRLRRSNAELNFASWADPVDVPRRTIAKRVGFYSLLPLIAIAAWVFYPSYLDHQNQKQLNELKLETAAYTGTDQKSKSLSDLQHVYQDKQKIRQSIADQDVPVSNYLTLIQGILPKDVTISQITMKKGVLSLNFNLQTPLQAAQLIASINQSGYFEEIKSVSVPLNRQKYQYSLDLKLLKPVTTQITK